jgi:hypothetical protein
MKYNIAGARNLGATMWYNTIVFDTMVSTDMAEHIIDHVKLNSENKVIFNKSTF